MSVKEHPRRSMPDETRSADLHPSCISRVPLSMTQKTAARRMLQSARDIPRFPVSMELNAGELAALRSRISNEPGVLGSEGGNVAYLDGSARWKGVDEMDVDFTGGEWGSRYPCLWYRRPTAGRPLVTDYRKGKVDCP